ncbi:hypothetical protein FJZ18_02265 [Candidatus Pacearchaeota archaeon]|nr:hypothetical protein [Candidatus Pacearchaeota archaeon]
MNKGIKVGIVVVVLLLLIIGIWKMSAPQKTSDDNKPGPVKPTPNTGGAKDSDSLDNDLITASGIDESDDSAILSIENIVSDEPA